MGGGKRGFQIWGGSKSAEGGPNPLTEVPYTLADLEGGGVQIRQDTGIFEKPKDIDDFTICPTHRSNLGTGVRWIRGSNSRCRVPKEVWCWAITPQKIEHRLNGRKHIVQLEKDPLPASKISRFVPLVPFTLFQNGFRSGTKLISYRVYMQDNLACKKKKFTSFFYASHAPKEDSYRCECRVAI